MRLHHRVSTTGLKHIRGVGYITNVRAPWYNSSTGWGWVWLNRSFL